MKIILFGATGYIGLPIAHALVRSGHIVVGVSRSDTKNKTLLANEIIPVVGDIFDPATWASHIPDADAVISVASSNIATEGNRLFKAIETTAASLRSPGTPKLTWIFASGTWIHGDNRSVIRSDGAPLDVNRMPKVASWLPALEQEFISSQVVNGIVIRPAMCYGRSGSLWAGLFEQVESGRLSWPGTPGGAYATVHIDDLAEVFLLAVEKSHLVRGLILDASNEQTESVDGILNTFAAHVGIPLEKVSYRPAETLLDEALVATTRVRPTLARSLLGWAPRKMSMMDGIATYYASFLAARQ